MLTLKYWRCGGILCSVCLVSLLIKDTKAYCLFCCPALFVCRNQCLALQKVENIFVAPPYCQCNFIGSNLLSFVIFQHFLSLYTAFNIYIGQLIGRIKIEIINSPAKVAMPKFK